MNHTESKSLKERLDETTEKLAVVTAERNRAEASRDAEYEAHRMTQSERDALKADKERLDWLEAHRLPLIPCFGTPPPMGSGLPFPFDGYVTRSNCDTPLPLRAAIDAARKEQP